MSFDELKNDVINEYKTAPKCTCNHKSARLIINGEDFGDVRIIDMKGFYPATIRFLNKPKRKTNFVFR